MIPSNSMSMSSRVYLQKRRWGLRRSFRLHKLLIMRQRDTHGSGDILRQTNAHHPPLAEPHRGCSVHPLCLSLALPTKFHILLQLHRACEEHGVRITSADTHAEARNLQSNDAVSQCGDKLRVPVNVTSFAEVAVGVLG
jgi:hypothetical protein